MTSNLQEADQKQAMHTIGVRVDQEFYDLWKQLPRFDRSEIVGKLVKHAMRCDQAKKEFHWDFNLQALEALWGQKKE
jgi:hypothetical protein